MAQGGSNTSVPLRFRYPDIFEELGQLLRGAGLNLYDVIANAVGPTQSNDVAICIRYGHNFEQRAEQTFSDEQLRTGSGEVICFIQDVVKDCQQQSVTDYRAFMRDVRP